LGFPIVIRVEAGRRIIGWPEIEQKLKEAGDVLMERAIELHRQAKLKKGESG
jgi:hypothetical protein